MYLRHTIHTLLKISSISMDVLTVQCDLMLPLVGGCSKSYEFPEKSPLISHEILLNPHRMGPQFVGQVGL